MKSSSDPEVYFTNHADGDDPVLPSGIHLWTALDAAFEGNSRIIVNGEDSIHFGRNNVDYSSIGRRVNFGVGTIGKSNSDDISFDDTEIDNGFRGSNIGTSTDL